MATWTPIGERAVQSIQPPTDSAPTQPDEGISLLSVAAVTVVLECDPGETFRSAAGTIDVYFYDGMVGEWLPLGDDNFQQALSTEVIGRQRAMVTLPVRNPRGRAAFVCNGLDVTAGSLTLKCLPTLMWAPPRAC